MANVTYKDKVVVVTGGEYTGPDAEQQLVGRVGNPMDIVNMMIYHGENGWRYENAEN